MTGSVIARLATAAVLTTALAASPAAATGYTPERVCGSGFHVLNEHTRSVTDHTNTLYGQVFLLYNGLTGEHCAVTMKRYSVGTPTKTLVTLLVRAGSFVPQHGETDEGAFRYYAGPVKVKAYGRCVAINGTADAPGAADASSGWGRWVECGRSPATKAIHRS
ncbi:Spore-associated protein A precursor [Nonomuraea coxensis DSM 45129]|uniref:Spore-associated protein A n=1 Tax=Nonomuraea coxensis DSM 45129 TaxID=1122611 RepID=A0ABX8U154_9ACTN|nr:hypothetical protein [Nonomuraea coxensis]QYC41492.1 Spore-associated protein A precursor [Nonomuraea coxensis DSM 45129]